jgi:hypothetical protein
MKKFILIISLFMFYGCVTAEDKWVKGTLVPNNNTTYQNQYRLPSPEDTKYNALIEELKEQYKASTDKEERMQLRNQILQVKLKQIEATSNAERTAEEKQFRQAAQASGLSMTEGWLYNAGNAAIIGSIWHAIWR